MSEGRGTSVFYNSCVKVPIDPCSRQPTPSYERSRMTEKNRKINFATADETSTTSSPRESLDNFLEFLESIPDYGQVNHLSNEQFKQKVEHLKRKQRLFLKNLRNVGDKETAEEISASSRLNSSQDPQKGGWQDDLIDLKLNGKKCYLEESRVASPIIFSSGTFAELVEDQDIFTHRCKRKEVKTKRNEEILLGKEKWYTLTESERDEDDVTESDDSIETRSLPPDNLKEWHPTVPKPFNFTLRENAEKYMNHVEKEAAERDEAKSKKSKKNLTRKRHARPVPLTSKIPLYDKLLAEKEERSRMVREESAINLMSQVRPFKLECDRRAWKSMSHSSPVICSKAFSNSRFKAKPVPKNLFATDVYDRMLEDEYYRQLRKRIRAAELMKSSSLPPSMARRERVKSTSARIPEQKRGSVSELFSGSTESSQASNLTSMHSERTKSALAVLSGGGTNLAAILRCQASREKLEREMREKMEEKRREQVIKMRENLIGRKPAWRALRSAARHEHERDLDIRVSLRRDEAREQAERHRLQMEMMLDRVTQIPTLFERHSQSFQPAIKGHSKSCGKKTHRKKKKQHRRRSSCCVDSFASIASSSRPNSGSITSSSGLVSLSRSSKSSSSKDSDKTVSKSESSSKKRADRGPLKVSINERAELIDDHIRGTAEACVDRNISSCDENDGTKK